MLTVSARMFQLQEGQASFGNLACLVHGRSLEKKTVLAGLKNKAQIQVKDRSAFSKIEADVIRINMMFSS